MGPNESIDDPSEGDETTDDDVDWDFVGDDDGDGDWKSYSQDIREEDRLRRLVRQDLRSLGPPVPELYFATIHAIGTPIRHTVIEPLSKALELVDFHLEVIWLGRELATQKVADLGIDPTKWAQPFDRYQELFRAGAAFRKETEAGDAVAIEAIRSLHEHRRREGRQRARELGRRGVAYLFRNLMTPGEARRLRRLYGRKLFILAVFSSEEQRRGHLATNLANHDPVRARDLQPEAAQLLRLERGHLPPNEELDLAAAEHKYRVNIPATWQYADLYLDITDTHRMADQIERLVELVFRHPFRTPRPDEVGMAEAFGGALESANLARPVGASIVGPHGELIAIGTNNVPRPGGGIYRGGIAPDHRDHTAGWMHDPSDRNRRGILLDLVERLLAEPSWLRILDQLLGFKASGPGEALAAALHETDDEDRAAFSSLDVMPIVDRLVASSVVWRSQFFDVIEFGRSLHAEMDALTSAARKGISTRDATMYTTTLPCHECARLIIAAGVRRVIFIEPYEKSRVMELYKTEVRLTTMTDSLSADHPDHRVHLIPYVGISPRRFHDLFAWVDRKVDDLDDDIDDQGRRERKLDGHIVDWHARRRSEGVRQTIASYSAFSSVSRSFDVLMHERRVLAEFADHYEKVLAGRAETTQT